MQQILFADIPKRECTCICVRVCVEHSCVHDQAHMHQNPCNGMIGTSMNFQYLKLISTGTFKMHTTNYLFVHYTCMHVCLLCLYASKFIAVESYLGLILTGGLFNPTKHKATPFPCETKSPYTSMAKK